MNKRTTLLLLYRTEQTWPNINILLFYYTLWVVAVTANLFKFYFLHREFKHFGIELMKFLVLFSHGITVIYGYFVCNSIILNCMIYCVLDLLSTVKYSTYWHINFKFFFKDIFTQRGDFVENTWRIGKFRFSMHSVFMHLHIWIFHIKVVKVCN